MSRAVRAGSCGGLAALLVLFGADSLQNATANGDTRTISFHHIHLKEDTTITYKVNGRYDAEAMKKVNHALRDWRTGQPIAMDPHLIDALWEVHRAVGSKEHIHVIGGYRSPATNAMLRRRSSGVAKSSQHMRGKAIDFFIPDAPLSAVREAGLRLQRGGVGFYPSSGAPFVHMDTGSVRHWPRLPQAQLAKIMAKGPLTQFAANTKASGATAVQRKSTPATTHARTVRDEDDDEVTTATPRRGAPARAPEAPVVVAAAIPLPLARPAAAPAVAEAQETQEAAPSGFQLASATSHVVRTPPRPAQAASLVARADTAADTSASSIINERGYWQGLVEPTAPPAASPEEAPRPPAYIPEFNGNIATGSTSPWPTRERASRGPALAYAPANQPVSTRVNVPGKAKVVARVAPDREAAPKPTVRRPPAAAARPASNAVVVKVGDRIGDPWLRAMMVAPSAQKFMSTSLYGAPDFAFLRAFLQKPTTSVMMTFSDDPHLGMSSDQFKGNAVVFVSTVTFRQQTAALR